MDPATEFEVIRLTDPSYSSFMPAYHAHVLSRRRNFMLFWCDRTGSPQAFQMELNTGGWRQLTDAQDLDGTSLALLPNERRFCYFDGPSLRVARISNLRSQEIYRLPDGWRRGPGFSVSSNGVHATFVETRREISRLRLVHIAKGNATTIVQADKPLSDPLPQPGRKAILYRRGQNSLWLAHYNGEQNRRLPLAPGGLGPVLWSPSGGTVLYLNFPEDRRTLHAIREFTPDTNADALVARTSQFVHFGQNANSSVFVGASNNKASPYVLILLRTTRRELTLCEHRASDPATVAPIFSPGSQAIYFQSDRDGRPAIYRIRVDKFVAKTES